MPKFSLVRPLLAVAALLAGGAAHAGGVQWSIGISLPPITFVGSNAGVAPAIYAPPVAYAPAYRVAPAPVFVAPAPVVYLPPRVVYAPQRVVRPVPMVIGGWAPGRDRHRHRGSRHGDWHDLD